MVGELVLKMLRRKVASSEGDEMVSVFNVVEQHVAFFQIFVMMLEYTSRVPKVCCSSKVFSCEA